MLKKVVVIGPEGTGKSTLCEKLAEHYHTNWCPEYARAYLLEYGTKYTYNDLLTIAKGQLALEEEYVQSLVFSQKSIVTDSRLPANDYRLLFIDTDMYVMKVWCEFVFGKCHGWILEQLAKRKYDLYLLCHTDLPWVKDELREYPELETRKRLFGIYKNLMLQQSTPWVEISGQPEERLQTAIKAVDNLLAG